MILSEKMNCSNISIVINFDMADRRNIKPNTYPLYFWNGFIGCELKKKAAQHLSQSSLMPFFMSYLQVTSVTISINVTLVFPSEQSPSTSCVTSPITSPSILVVQVQVLFFEQLAKETVVAIMAKKKSFFIKI